MDPKEAQFGDKDVDIHDSFRRKLAESSAEKRDFLRWFLRTFDLDGLVQIQRRHREMGTKQQKYHDVAFWLDRKWSTVEQILSVTELPRSATILDIGCGPGHMAVILRYLGYDTLGMDVPDQELYRDLVDYFQVERVSHIIEPRQSLPPLGRTFDLVTSTSSCFYRVGKKRAEHRLWTKEEWDFFLREVATTYAQDNTGLYMTLNPAAHAKGMHYWDAEFSEFIRAKGGTIDASTVYLPNIASNCR